MTVNLGFVVPFGEKPKAAPAVEEPAPVAAADCSTLDSDNDGVNNCLDQCPNTMVGSKVDADGCPIRIELKGVNFEYYSANFDFKRHDCFGRCSSSLISAGESKPIEVQGHTSSEGSNAYNLKIVTTPFAIRG